MDKTIMKKILTAVLVVVSLMITTTLSAQDKFITFGVKAGLNLSNMSGDLDGDIKPGFNAGITVDLRLLSNLYILSGLEYSQEGTKFKGGDLGFIKVDDAKVTYSFLKMPVHLGYKLPVTDNMKIVFHGGPYLAYGIDGKMKWGSLDIDLYDDNNEGWKSDRFDLGLGFGVGAEVSNFCFNVGCDFGLLNQVELKSMTDKETWEGVDVKSNINSKNMNINISVGYKF